MDLCVKILAVDDDETMTRFYERSFADEWIKIQTFNRPDEGLAYFLKESPNLVILDAVYAGEWAIPTGYDLAKKIREYDNEKTTIVMVTANKRGLDSFRIGNGGVDAIFYKGEEEAIVLIQEILKVYQEKNK